ncbi:MAG: hypothetical protein GEV09_27160 [Pseudonocardiaceae bacterium]|nr:hypothetical protein [Pseudonocardiaceae bacterium]
MCVTAEEAPRWVLKGAGALLARLPEARHSKDIDMYCAEFAADVEEATAALRVAATSETTTRRFSRRSSTNSRRSVHWSAPRR